MILDMNFTMPCDFKISTIDELIMISNKYENRNLIEVYGNIYGYFPINSGRGFLGNSKYCSDLKSLAKYIRYINKYNIQFNYTINASCTENMELIQEYQKEIIKCMDKLIEIGIKKFTVASMSLLGLLRYIYKDKILITLSTISDVNSVKRAIEAEKLGVNTIVLSEDSTRNIPLIRNIRKAIDCNIEIIVNSMCLWNCIYRQSHYNSLAHMKIDYQTKTAFFPNQCYLIKKNNPIEWIKSPWIRPEDIYKYEALGVNLFKFIGREIKDIANWPKLYEIYCKGYYNGNLLELLYAFSEKPSEYINNTLLNGFVDYFFEHNFHCYDVCGLENCKYCKEYCDKSYERYN